MTPEKIIDFLERWETLPLALATKIGIWITPLIPAYFAQRAIVSHLHAPEIWGWLAAIALEVVGVASVKSLLNAYTWEQERRKSDPAAPIIWNIVAASTYYITAFLLVLFLEFWPETAKLAPAAFVLLAGTSALVVALADDQKRREKAVSEKNVSKRSTRRSVTVSDPGQPDQSKGQHPGNDHLLTGRRSKQHQAETALLTYYADHPNAPHSHAAQAVNRSRSWVSGKLSDFEAQNIIKRNGNGVEILNR